MRVMGHHVRGHRENGAVPGHGFRLGIEIDSRTRLLAGDKVGMINHHVGHALLHVRIEPVPDEPRGGRHLGHPPGRLPRIAEVGLFAVLGDEFPHEVGRLPAASFPQFVRPLAGQAAKTAAPCAAPRCFENAPSRERETPSSCVRTYRCALLNRD